MRNFTLLFLAMFLQILAPAQAQQPTATTKNGLVEGSTTPDGMVASFKGIPFAAPPLGELRWKAPQPVANWSGSRDCTRFGPSAMQATPAPFFVWSEEFLIPKAPISEDCLYLNVWSPTAAIAKEKLPVIVWVHGGGFTSGGGACPIYDGEGMARKGVVFVSINYRVGIFGFFAHPELSRESGHGASGNYAFLDMVAALQWVQQNIAAFGGDPGRVTIAGQSAGSFAVNALVASPLAKGLFHRAIGQSGGMFGDRALSLPAASLAGLDFMKKMGKTSLSELRQLSADSLLPHTGSHNSPVQDGYVLPKEVHAIFAEGQQNDVPTLTGWNRDEGFIFGKTMTAEEWRADAVAKYGGLAEEFLRAFPASDDAVAKQSQKHFFKHMAFAWQNYTWAKLQAEKGKQKAWLYRFDRVPPGRPDLAEHGAFHSAEIAYALHSLPMWNRPWEPTDQLLMEQMSGYWANFAATGDPNGPGLPRWEAYHPAAHNIMVLGEKTGVRTGLEQAEFSVLDTWKAASQPELSSFKKKQFRFGDDSIQYRILLPKDYDPTKKYPLLLFLHGSGERGSDNEAQLVHGAKLFLKPQNQRDFPAIVLFPQCPADASWNTMKADRSKSPIERSFDYSGAMTRPLRMAIELTLSLVNGGSVDPTRVYIAGLSMGGMGTFEAVARYPGVFAAAAPICGGGDGKHFGSARPKTPMRIFHGAADSVVDVKYSREMHEHLKAAGWPVEYVEYPAVDHNSWDYAFAERDFLSWLFAKKRGK